MATNNFLDQAGLGYLWTKILAAIESHSVTLPDKLVSYKAAMAITATEKLNADTLGGYSAAYFAKSADVSTIQETIRTQASEILKAQQAVSSMGSTVSSLVKNKANSTHADRHAKGGADPITPESIGAAPGGYGLGNNVGQSILDVNEAILGGFYFWGPKAKNTPFPYGAMVVIPRSSTTAKPSVTQIASAESSGLDPQASIAVRKSTDNGDGKWGPWEWINPPMELGIEYRTTERYFGKPVYVKMVNLGEGTNGKTVNVGTMEMIHVECRATYGSWSLPMPELPFGSTDRSLENIRAQAFYSDANTVTIIMGSMCPAFTATAKVYYTKATD